MSRTGSCPVPKYCLASSSLDTFSSSGQSRNQPLSSRSSGISRFYRCAKRICPPTDCPLSITTNLTHFPQHSPLISHHPTILTVILWPIAVILAQAHCLSRPVCILVQCLTRDLLEHLVRQKLRSQYGVALMKARLVWFRQDPVDFKQATPYIKHPSSMIIPHFRILFHFGIQG